MSLFSRQSLQNKQCFHNLYAYLSAARNMFHSNHPAHKPYGACPVINRSCRTGMDRN
jgi:hypothetical protein